MEVAREVEVAIIGGGLSGSALAILLARSGLSVALLERSTFPRDKVCGEFLSWDALPILDLLGVRGDIDGLGAPVISRCTIPAAKYAFELPGRALGLTRRALDELLFRHARISGAEAFEGTTVTHLNPATRSLNALSATGEIAMKWKVLIGAWGRWGRFDHELERSFVESAGDRYFGFKRHFSAKKAISPSIDLHSFHRGYLGVSPVEGGRVNICGLVHESRIKAMRGGWESFVEEIRAEHPDIEELFASHDPLDDQYLTTEPVVFRPKSATTEGVFFAGDAAAQIDPLTGNGMAMALQSAALLAPFVTRQLQGDADARRAYEQSHREFFSRRIRWSRTVSFALRRPTLLQTTARLLPFRSIGRMLTARTRASDAEVKRLVALAGAASSS